MNKLGLCIGILFSINCYAQDTIVMPATGNGGFYNTCYATVLDSGIDSNYTNDNHATVTISPLWVESVSLYFESFDTEVHFDSLSIYDGPGTAFPLIGTYSGNMLQGQTIQSTGSSITLEFRSDDIVTGTGFKAWVSCQVGTEEQNASQILLYPNPANIFVQIGNLDQSKVDKIFVLDAMGRSAPVECINSMVNVQHLAPGFYTLRIETTTKKMIYKKFMKI